MQSSRVAARREHLSIELRRRRDFDSAKVAERALATVELREHDQRALRAAVAPAAPLAAASAHLQAVDKVYLDVRDPDGLARETHRARGLGFTGKAVIHPGQIQVVHRIYRPTDEEVEHARRVVAAFEAAEGEGSIAVDGRMADLPIVERARRILELYRETS